MDPRTQLKAHWDDAQGRVKQAWGALTDDDLLKAQGNWDQLVAAIRSKTGESIDAVEKKLNGIIDAIGAKGEPKQKDESPDN